MKTFTTTLCLVLLTLFAVTSNAQSKRSGKPQLFASLPTTIELSETQLHDLFVLAQGQNAELAVTASAKLSGIVTSNLVKYDNLQTLVIKLPAFNNTLFSVSRQAENHSIKFVGRIFNPLFDDGFELRKTENGLYQLVKIGTANTLTDCSL